MELDPRVCGNNYAILRSMDIVKSLMQSGAPDLTTSLDLPRAPGSSFGIGEVQICEICESGPAQYYCAECPKLRSLCHDCFSLRHKKAPMNAHTASPWKPSITNVRLCADHNLECLMYCRTDNVVLCNLCSLGSHKGHDVHLIAEEVNPCIDRIRGAVASLEASGRVLQQVGSAVGDTYEATTGRSLHDRAVDTTETVGGSVGEVVRNIREFFGTLHDSLAKREAELLQAVQAIERSKAGALQGQMDDLSVQLARNYIVASSVKENLDPQAKCWLLENEKDLMIYVNDQIRRERGMQTVPVTNSGVRFTTKPEGLSSWERAIAALGSVEEYVPSPEILSSPYHDSPGKREGRDREGGAGSEARAMASDVAAASLLVRSHSEQPQLGTACRLAFNGDSSDNYTETANKRLSALGLVSDVVDEVTYGRMPAGAGAFVKTLSSYGKGPGQLKNPKGICFYDGYLFVAEPGNNRVQVFDEDGKHECFFEAECGIECPSGVFAATLVGRRLLFVLESDTHCLQVLEQDGSYVGAIGSQGSGPGQLQKPSLLTCDGRYLYVADSNNNRISVFQIDGTFVKTIGSQGHGNAQFSYPSGVCVAKGKLFVTDLANHRVVVMSHDGSFLGVMGSKGNGPAQLSNPTDICCYNGVLFVTDSGNHRVQVFSCEGEFLGSIGSAGNGEGELSYPLGICCSDEVLYVADSGNHRIQVFSLY